MEENKLVDLSMNFAVEIMKFCENIDFKNGNIRFFLDDEQDMIEIRYADGMLIDVGYVAEDKRYYITVVESDDKIGWHNPLEIIEIDSKEKLSAELQRTIIKYR